MDKKELQELLKRLLSSFKENTLMDLAEKDISYQESSKQLDQAEERLREMKAELTEAQQKVLDDYLVASDKNNVDYSDITYIAGMRDMLKILFIYS